MKSTIRCRPLLGTYVEIGVMASGDAASRAIEAAFDSVSDVHRLLSFHDPESDLSRLNREGRRKWVRLHPLSLRVLRLARNLTKLSDGFFNCTVGGEMVAGGDLPDHLKHLSTPATRGTADDLLLQTDTARLASPVLITLDGIAKGYAVDMAVRALKHAGLTEGWVNAGGDMRAYGPLILPLHQRDSMGVIHPLGGLRNAAVATSRQALCRDPRFPGRIVGKEIGDSAPCTWSVIARRAWRADALTKVAANAPEKERDQWVERFGGRLIHLENSAEVAA